MSEEQPNYKDLYEQIQTEIAEKKTQAVEENKRRSLHAAGYSEEQAEKFLSHIDGNADSEIKQSVRRLAEDIPPAKKVTYTDPSAANSKRQKARKPNGEEVGRHTYKRLRDRGRLIKWGRGVRK